MNSSWNRREPLLIKLQKQLAWPCIKFLFRLKIKGLEQLSSSPTLYISNHNVGALIESHSILFSLDDHFQGKIAVYGFTHPSLFRIFGIKSYFEWLGAVPATHESAKKVFDSNHSVLIFPGGNKQALRSIFDYKKNSFRESHGWAKIAKDNHINVVPVTFKGSHFVNPILFQSSLLAKILIFPWAVGVKWVSFSLAQLMTTLLGIYFMRQMSISWVVVVPVSIMIFSLNALTALLPFKIHMTFHRPLKTNEMSQKELEDKVADIMDHIYDD